MRWMLLSFLLVLGLTACAPSAEELPEPIALLETAAQQINSADTFKIEVWREGAPYYIISDVIDGDLLFERATMSYVSPDVIEGTVRAQLGVIPFTLKILARGDLQWVQLPGLGWSNELYFAYGFNPEQLIAQETGFRAALSALINIEMLGRDSIDGIPVYHLRGDASGAAVTDLLVGLIEFDERVIIDAYIHAETRYPTRLIITMPGTETEEVPQPTQWYIEVYDFNQPVEITGPEA